MIDNLIQLLRITEYYGVSKNIDIAKGINCIPKTYKAMFKQVKRTLKSK